MIVEDNSLVGELIADEITKRGGESIGPYDTIDGAATAIASLVESPDVVLLDVNLDGTTFDIAAQLRRRGIPFIFVTGNASDIPAEFKDAIVCCKPFSIASLLMALRVAFAPQEQV